MTITTEDARYEHFVRPLEVPVARRATRWRWEGWNVHVEHVGADDAPVRVLLVHGAGGNAAAMWPFAAHLATLGAKVTTLDLPGYGRTTPPVRRDVTHTHWQRVLVDLIRLEADDRPLVLMGASMGGMLALDVAAATDDVAHVVATCLLDLTDPTVRSAVMRAPWLGRLAALLSLARGPLARLRLPMRLLVPMERISNHPGLAAEALADPRGGRTSMPLGWFRTLVATGSTVAPEEYAGPPVLLLHPGDDRWTLPHLSTDLLARLTVPTRTVMLPGCGHFPVEEPGFQTLLDEVSGVIADVSARGPGSRVPPPAGAV